MLTFEDYKKSMNDQNLSMNEDFDSTNDGRLWKFSYWYWNSPYDLKTMTLGNKIEFHENQDMPSWVVTEEDARLYLLACTHTNYVPAYQYPGKYDISLITREKAEETQGYAGVDVEEDIKSIESLYNDIYDNAEEIKHSGILIKDVTDNEGNIINVVPLDGCESLTDPHYKYSKFTVDVKLRGRSFTAECPDWVNSKADVYAFMCICMNDSIYIDVPRLCDRKIVKDYDIIGDEPWYSEFEQGGDMPDEYYEIITKDCLKNRDWDGDLPIRFVSYTDDKGQTYKI